MSDIENQVAETINKLHAELTSSEKEELSKVLFPDLHNTYVTLLGKERELRPLVVKWAKKLRVCMKPYAEKLAAASNSPTPMDVDLELLDGITRTTRMLAEIYGWDDVIKAIDEEDLTASEIQSVVTTQVQLQGENDFLLTSLRVAVMVMQIVEIQNRRYRTLLGGRKSLERLVATPIS